MLPSSKTRSDATKLSDTVEATLGELKDVNDWLSTTSELVKRKIEADRSSQKPDFGKWLNGAHIALSRAVRDEAW